MITTILQALGDASLRIGLLLALVLALRPWLRKRISAGSFFAIWSVLGVLLVIPIAVPSVYSPYNLIPRFAPKSAPARLQPVRTVAPRPEAAASAPAAGVVSAIPPGVSVDKVQVAAFSLTGLQIALGLWIGGGGILAGWHILSTLAFRRRIRRDRRDVDQRTEAILRESATSLGIDRPILACVTGAVPTPAVHGLLHPELLFPKGFSGRLDDSQLRLVILHELGHIQRRDLWSLAILRVAAFIHWFNPLVWIAASAARRDCEHACDGFVLRQIPGSAPETYAETLVSILRLLGKRAPISHGLGVIGHSARIAGRIDDIIEHRPDSGIRRAGGLAAAVIIAAVGISCGKAGQLASTALPEGWETSPLESVGNPAVPPTKYTVGLTPRITHDGKPSMFIQGPADGSGPGRTISHVVPADAFRNKRVRLSLWVKTERVGNTWMQFSANRRPPQGKVLMNGNIVDMPIDTEDWKLFASVIDVPPDADILRVTIGLINGGTLFVADPKLEIVGADIPATGWVPQPVTRGSVSRPSIPELKFTAVNRTATAAGWFVNGNAPSLYRSDITSDTVPDGMSAAMTRSITTPTILERLGISSKPQRFGGMMQTIDAAAYVGKRVEISALIRTEDAVTGGGHLWIRRDGMVDGRKTSWLDNMGRHPVNGTQSWRRESLSMDIEKTDTAIAFGYFLEGKGAMWVSDFQFKVLEAPSPK